MVGRAWAWRGATRWLIEQDESGVYVATAPALPGVAMRFTLDSMVEEGEEHPPSDASRSLDLGVRDPLRAEDPTPSIGTCVAYTW
jgi:hypothetical protein